MIRAIWFLCIAAILWFALIPAEMGGVGGSEYHAVAFLMLGLLTPAAFPRIPLRLVWVTLVMFGGAIELAQGMMDAERYGEWDDFTIDAVTATVGIVYYRFWLYLRARNARQEASSKEASDSATQDRN